MKKLTFLSSVFCLMALVATAAPAASLKLAVVDIDEVFSAYDSAYKISDMVRSIAQEGAAERERLRAEISLIESEARERAGTITESQREDLAARMQRKVYEYRDFDRAQSERENKPVHEALEQIYKTIEAYGKDNGFDLILEKRVGIFGRTVLFSVERLDITEEIIKNL